MNLSLAVQITLLRIILAPIIVGCIFYQQWIWGVVLFVCAVFTDFLDGFVARRYHQESRLGQLLDPIADKILIVSLMYTIFLVKFISSDNGISMQLLGWFFIAKEATLLSAAAGLYYQYNLFFKPTFFSRFVSVSEMVIIFETLALRAFFVTSSESFFSNFGKFELTVKVIYGFQVYLTMFLSLVLLIQYGVLVILFLREKQ